MAITDTFSNTRGWLRTGVDEVDEKVWDVRAGGRWDLAAIAEFGGELAHLRPEGEVGVVRIDLSELAALDTVGAVAIRRFCERLGAEGYAVEVSGAKELHAALLEAAREGCETGPEGKKAPAVVEEVARTGRATIEVIKECRELLAFFGLVLISLGRLLTGRGKIRFVPLAAQIERAGLNSMPIVGLLSFLIGVVLAYQGAAQLQRFGAEIFVVNLLGVSILREIGVLMTAIIIAGRSGASFTAQIGTMMVRQEVDAMRTMGLDPMEVLVVPRVLALMLALPLLAFYADILGLAGGAVMSYFTLGIGFDQFVAQLDRAVSLDHFWVGMVKAPVFAFVIALVGCYQGLKVTGSAESVGRSTTQSVVEAIFLVITLDALFSVFFSYLGV